MDPRLQIAPPRSAVTPARTAVAGAVGMALLLMRCSGAQAAGLSLPPVTVGAGIQAGFFHCDKACLYSPGTPTTAGGSVDGLALDSMRLYINGNVTKDIKMTFDTEYTGSGSSPGSNKVEVLDAIGRFEFSKQLNFWVGRFLPPSDRANLYGPYYANDWTPYADGVADYYPSVAVGRDNGVAYWGQFGILKVQVGAFDGQSLNSAVANKGKLLTAARLMLDFWDPEPGYYLNGTYYGEKNILAVGVAAQSQDGKSAWDLDGLMERRLANAGAVSVEAEYQSDNGLTAATHSDGWYGLVSYLFPQKVGVGKFQPLIKYSQKSFHAFGGVAPYKLKTTEVDFNYVIQDFNARVGMYFLTQQDDRPFAPSPKEFGLKMQLQM